MRIPAFQSKAAEPIGAAAEVTRAQQSSRSVKSDEGLEVGQLAGESPVITVQRIERFLGRVSARRLAASDEMKSDGGNQAPELPTGFHGGNLLRWTRFKAHSC